MSIQIRLAVRLDVATLARMDRYRVQRGDGHAYLCTCAFVKWLPLFNGGPAYFEIVLDSLKLCRANKGLVLHAHVLMIDHLHLILRHEDVSAFMRDFKSWTALKIVETLQRERRADWLHVMMITAQHDGKAQEFQVWQEGFHPKAITSDSMMLQKLRYLHNNPVRKGFVTASEEWSFSSASNYVTGKGVLEIDAVGSLIT